MFIINKVDFYKNEEFVKVYYNKNILLFRLSICTIYLL